MRIRFVKELSRGMENSRISVIGFQIEWFFLANITQGREEKGKAKDNSGKNDGVRERNGGKHANCCWQLIDQNVYG